MLGTLYLAGAAVLWGLVHSILAANTVKAAARRFFGPVADRIYRFSYNLFALASFFPLALMLYTFPDRPVYAIPEPWVYLTMLVQGAAFYALLAGVMQTGLFEFAGLTQLSRLDRQAAPQLVTDGLYAHVRHPLYTAGLILIWLNAEMTINRLVLWAFLTLYLLIGAWFEERKLLKEFGAVYAEYQARTPMFLPRLHLARSRS
jgi:protein-S-isoprenylcysteine O-methyltransferase Ste14